MIPFVHPQQQLYQQQHDTFEQGLIKMHERIDKAIPLDKLRVIVLTVAYQSTHENHTVAEHLLLLLKNRADCSERCAEKFLKLLEDKANE